jgi:restriction system protein
MDFCMTVPSYQDMMLPMLRLVSAGNQTILDCLPALTLEFGLTSEDTERMLPSGKQTLLSNRAHWARQYLSQAGLVIAIKRGHYEITKSGTELLQSNPALINIEVLRRYPKFLDFQQRSGRASDGTDPLKTNDVSSAKSETPDDLIAQSFAQIENALIGELLAAVLSVSPQQFEQLIVDLLLAMGYGGGDKSMGERIGKSGDGGIDGIINEDKLGLDAVYIQAKRYAPDSKVGRPALQAFVGSLTGEGANKGVFVTTSDFSKEARDYLHKVQHRIVLINGDRLARLMIQYEVGVRARNTYVLRSVDEDYFSEI